MHITIRASITAFALATLAAGCSHFPASPVPAAMTDLQANRLASSYLADHSDRRQLLHSALRQSDGYLLAYTSVFDADAKPPRESHLIIVRNDGSVREVVFEKNH